MSAIFGIWHLDGQPVELSHLQKMQDNVRHYGRDGDGIELQQNIGLGCCLNKLSIQSQEEKPIHAESKQDIFVVSDALIYNRDELIHEHRLAGNNRISNQALLLAAYQKWGVNFPKHINGDFAFVIWERQKKQLLVVRDHLGVRPLYYFYSQSTFAFATDFRALLALPFVSKQFNEVKLYVLLNYTVLIDPEATYFEQIKRLPQAHLLRVDSQGIQKQKYWTPDEGGQITFATENQYTEALYALVDDAIKRRVHSSDYQFGAELSGGLDSSVITVLANRQLAIKNKRLPLITWAPSFDLFTKQPRDERELIEQLCLQERLDCIYYEPDKSLAHKKLSRAVPIDGGSVEVIQHQIAKMSTQGVRLILSGWGGDQGISRQGSLRELFFAAYWGNFISEVCYSAKGSPLHFIKLLIANTVWPRYDRFGYFVNPNVSVPSIVKPEFAKRINGCLDKNNIYFTVNPVKQIESGSIQTRTEMIAWVGADYNIQYVFPFLDYRLVNFAMSIPRFLFCKQGIHRYIFRKAFESILPKELCYYMYKDDIARSTFRKKDREKHLDEKERTIDMLDYELFSQYIDLAKASDLVKSQEIKKVWPSRLFLHKSIEGCYSLQQMLAETER